MKRKKRVVESKDARFIRRHDKFRKFFPTLKSRFCIGVGKDFTKRLLSEVRGDVEKVFVVGSAAKGISDAYTRDVDLVVVAKNHKKVEQVVRQISSEKTSELSASGIIFNVDAHVLSVEEAVKDVGLKTKPTKLIYSKKNSIAPHASNICFRKGFCCLNKF